MPTRSQLAWDAFWFVFWSVSIVVFFAVVV